MCSPYANGKERPSGLSLFGLEDATAEWRRRYPKTGAGEVSLRRLRVNRPITGRVRYGTGYKHLPANAVITVIDPNHSETEWLVEWGGHRIVIDKKPA
jgi:hypothetical protein